MLIIGYFDLINFYFMVKKRTSPKRGQSYEKFNNYASDL